MRRGEDWPNGTVHVIRHDHASMSLIVTLSESGQGGGDRGLLSRWKAGIVGQHGVVKLSRRLRWPAA